MTLAYFGLTAATFAPLQNVIPRMIENASSPSAKAIDLGIVTGLGALAAVVANPLAGHMSDRRASVDNRTGMVLVGIVSGAVFLYLLGRQESIAGITVFWVLSQAAVNAVYASLPASIVDQIPPDNWGAVWGLVGTAQALGLVVGFAFVGVIFSGISAGITSLVILYVVTLVPFTVVAARLPKKAGKSTATDIRFIVELAKHSGFRSVWLGRFLVILANTIALLYLYYYLQDVIHYKKPGEGQLILVTIATIATALAAVTAGRLADRSGRYRIFVVQAVVAMAVAGFVLAAIGTWAIAIAAAFALGAGYGVVASAGQALSAQVLPDFASAGRDLGIMNIANTVPQVIGPPVAAGLIYLGTGYRGLFAFAAALALVAAYIIYRLRLPARRLDMRILIGSDTYYPQIDGTSYFTQRLAAGLAGHGHDVHVLCPADPALTSTPRTVPVHTVPSFMTPFHPTQRVCLTAAIRRQAGQAVRTIRPDVIHVQGHFPICRTLMVIAKERSIPLVATNHFMPENLVPYYFFPRWARGSVRSWAWRDVARWFAYPQVITTPTDIAADVLRTHGVDRPVTVISGGVDTARFSPDRGDRGAARRKLGLPDKPTIVYVGRLSADKAVTDLIELRVADRTHFLGFIPNEDIVAVYLAADVFCMPGRAELQSLATLEALSCGLPAVAARATALPHLVTDEVNGFLYPPGDIAQLAHCLCRVLRSPAESAKMGRASREIALAHDADLTVAQYEQTYQQASGQRLAD